MAKEGKRLKAAREQYDPRQRYALADALALVKQLAPTKFDAAVELHCHLGIDPKKGEQTVRATVTLPHGTGKTVKVAAFVTPAQEAAAREAGADVVGGEELINEIKNGGKFDVAVAVAVPEIMRSLSQIAKTLGQRGLMPNPKAGTVTDDVAKTIRELKAGRVAFKNDDGGNLHLPVGRVSFPPEYLLANAEAALAAIRGAKPDGIKGTFLENVVVTSTMGPGIKVRA